jgi:hypothetical protein
MTLPVIEAAGTYAGLMNHTATMTGTVTPMSPTLALNPVYTAVLVGHLQIS